MLPLGVGVRLALG